MSRPSDRALDRRIAQAERQETFALQAGWLEVAAAYRDLADRLRSLRDTR